MPASPLPGGRPRPSGGIAKNSPSSCCVAGDPKPKWVVSCASALTVNERIARHRDAALMQALRVNIGHTPIGGDAPTLNGVQMIDRAERPVRSADGDQLRQCRLNVAGLIDALRLGCISTV